MPQSCNLRFHHLKQLESEFAASQDVVRRQQLAQEIVALHAEFGSRNVECERLVEHGRE